MIRSMSSPETDPASRWWIPASIARTGSSSSSATGGLSSCATAGGTGTRSRSRATGAMVRASGMRVSQEAVVKVRWVWLHERTGIDVDDQVAGQPTTGFELGERAPNGTDQIITIRTLQEDLHAVLAA